MHHLPWRSLLSSRFSSSNCPSSLKSPSFNRRLQRLSSSNVAPEVAENEAVGAAETVVKKKKKKKKKQEPVIYAGPCDGAKKDTSLAMPNAYHPQYVEAAWRDWWESMGIFSTADKSEDDPSAPTKRRRYSIVLPPPNVTGDLHIGHALTVSVQDALCRWRRMCGDKVTWVPGFDHAGIATQSVVEKKLWTEEGKTREDIGRDEFVRRVKSWKDQKASAIENQLRRLGASLDWNRRVFTLDSSLSSAVDEAFIRLHDRGLIYRSLGLVNWCCHLRSTISDVEVDNVVVEGRTELSIPDYDEKVTFGVMDSLAYRLEGTVSGGEIVVSTTRLETMLADVAVAVHPEDDRYQPFVGQNLKHPFRNCSIPVIADPSVDRAFGTGAVKVTPAHDKRDFELARRHSGLTSPITMLNESGHVVAQFDEFAGSPRFTARRRVREALESLGLFRGSRDHTMTLPICSRSGDVVEPMLRKQWFLDCGHMSSQAIDVVAEGKLEFQPSFHAKVWNHFLAQQRDWCISRQLWWGHRIPAYRVSSFSKLSSSSDEETWVAARTEAEAYDKAAQLTGVESSRLTLSHDPDVLDTWFSSALFPFSALGWPSESEEAESSGNGRTEIWRDKEDLFPLSVMETGHDILFFWVARMVMLGLQLTNTLPFQKVLLHGMIRDAHGRKMSKSLGNVVDPLDVMTGKDLEALAKQLEDSGLSPTELEIAKDGQQKSFPEGIPECGADALRFALLSCDIQSVDVSMDILNIRHQRHFCNKIWQATRFLFHHLNAREFAYIHVGDEDCDTSLLSKEDRDILNYFQAMVNDCNEGLEMFELRFATGAIHRFIWFQLCDVYLEYTKPFLNNLDCVERNVRLSVILFCLEGTMRALHPFMPFLTEELWQRLITMRSESNEIRTICLADYPQRR